jgi:hypothetical protein
LQRTVLLTAAAIGLLWGCASDPTMRNPNEVVLPPAAGASAPAAVGSAAAAPAAAAPRAAVKGPAPRWSLNESDKTLKAALERWSQTAGWRLLWELGVDYRIGAAATVDGSFEDAVSTVMHNLNQAEVPPKAIFYRGNQVVRIVARGME